METVLGLKNMEIAKQLVEDFVLVDLYPLEQRLDEGDPEFEVIILASTGLTTQEDYRIYLTTTLPDGMLYEVVQLVTEKEPHLIAYKNINEEELE